MTTRYEYSSHKTYAAAELALEDACADGLISYDGEQPRIERRPFRRGWSITLIDHSINHYSL